jgi:hypothetical protein
MEMRRYHLSIPHAISWPAHVYHVELTGSWDREFIGLERPDSIHLWHCLTPPVVPQPDDDALLAAEQAHDDREAAKAYQDFLTHGPTATTDLF